MSGGREEGQRSQKKENNHNWALNELKHKGRGMGGGKHCSTICFVSLCHATCTAGVIDDDRVQMRFAQHVVIIAGAPHLLTVEKAAEKEEIFLRSTGLSCPTFAESRKEIPFPVM